MAIGRQALAHLIKPSRVATVIQGTVGAAIEAGEPAESAGTKSAVAGYVVTLPNEQNDTQWLMVQPQTVAFA